MDAAVFSVVFGFLCYFSAAATALKCNKCIGNVGIANGGTWNYPIDITLRTLNDYYQSNLQQADFQITEKCFDESYTVEEVDCSGQCITAGYGQAGQSDENKLTVIRACVNTAEVMCGGKSDLDDGWSYVMSCPCKGFDNCNNQAPCYYDSSKSVGEQPCAQPIAPPTTTVTTVKPTNPLPEPTTQGAASLSVTCSLVLIFMAKIVAA